MKAIIYNSKSLIQLNEGELHELAEEFAIKNEQLRVTGYLCFYKSKFFQYIEGDDEVVTDLMARIALDDRHEVIRTYEKEIQLRKFPAWGMKYLTPQSFPEISLEKLVIRYFDQLELSVHQKDNWTKLIWGSVDRLASLQKNLRAQ